MNDIASYEVYLADVLHNLHKHPEWRAGQTYFNVLHDHRPDLTNAIWGTDKDPFYKDSLLTAFHDYVTENW